jgi:hypothetical protein
MHAQPHLPLDALLIGFCGSGCSTDAEVSLPGCRIDRRIRSDDLQARDFAQSTNHRGVELFSGIPHRSIFRLVLQWLDQQRERTWSGLDRLGTDPP